MGGGDDLHRRRILSQSWRYDDRKIRATLSFESQRTWQETVAEALAASPSP